MRKIGISLLTILLLSTTVKGQFLQLGNRIFCADSGYCETGVVGMLPSTWIEFSYEKSTPFGADDGSVDIGQFRRSEASIRLPLLNSDGLKMVVGFAYKQEYMGASDPNGASDFPWASLDGQRINKRGLDLIWMHPFRGSAYTVGRAAANISNDRRGLNYGRDFEDTQFSYSQIFVVRPSNRTELGFGVSAKYGQNRTSIYPVVIYNHTFSSKWGIESLLPSFVRLRRNLGPTAALLFQAKGTGGAFNMDLEGVNNFENMIFRRSEIRVGVTYQQEIIDPLWIGLELGFRQPMNYNVFEPSAPRSAVSSTSLGSSTYINASVFLVPPSKLIKKLTKRN